jgi:archaellum component FlaF (FlaF/FlaG flagellin family)
VFLENGKDYLKGFGSGIFNGGNGKDALELTSGSYTVGISGTAVNFTKGSTVMNTAEFEILIAGNTIYNFASLTNGQIITVA